MPVGASDPGSARRAARTGLGIALLTLAVLYRGPIWTLIEFARSSDLYSHVLMVPLVSLYLAWDRKREVAGCEIVRGPRWAVAAAVLGLFPLALWWTKTRWMGWQPATQDSLFLLISSFVFLSIAIGLFFAGRRLVWSMALPVGMLFFLVPFPTGVEAGIETFFQHASADFSSILFQASGTPFVRQGLVFHLPHISLEVARECSGIRSSLVLFITSIVAGYLFLRGPWRRTTLALAIIPLAIVRNGLRIFTIGMLCAHVDPAMIHSWVHLRGGPLFFALSLVPFFALLLWLRRSERSSAGALEDRLGGQERVKNPGPG